MNQWSIVELAPLEPKKVGPPSEYQVLGEHKLRVRHSCSARSPEMFGFALLYYPACSSATGAPSLRSPKPLFTSMPTTKRERARVPSTMLSTHGCVAFTAPRTPRSSCPWRQWEVDIRRPGS
eukprot:9378387-Pyramimonas_sp.AAC.1